VASIGQLDELPPGSALTVVLSAHLVRYAVLPWSPALGNEPEWLAYARHTFASIHGAAAAEWSIRLCRAGRRRPRVACAIDASLLEALLGNERIVSIQPRLMAEFNERRAQFGQAPAWFVLQEPGRLTLSLIADGEWKLIRTRQVPEEWRSALPGLLARESAASGEPACERVVLVEAH
jgi:hypothetical protein